MADRARTQLTIRVTLIQNALRFFRSLRNEVRLLQSRVRMTQSAFASFIRQVRKITSLFVIFFIFRRIFLDIRQAIEGVVKKAIDFQAELKRIKALSDESESSILRLGFSLLQLSVKTGETTSQLTKYGQIASRAGIRGTENLVKVIETMAKMKVSMGLASEDDLSRFMRMANIFEVSAKDYERFGSVLAKLERQIPGTAKEILDLMRLLGAGRATTQLTVQEASALSAMMVSLGLKFRTTGMQINKFYQLLSDPDKLRIIERAIGRTLGKEAVESLDQVRQGSEESSEAINIFAGTLLKMPLSEVTRLLKDLGLEGNRFRMIFDAIREHQERYNKLLGVANDEWLKGTELEKRFRTEMEAAGKQLGRLWRGFDAIKTVMAMPFLEPLRKEAKKLADILQTVDYEQLAKDAATFWKVSADKALKLGGVLGTVAIKVGVLLAMYEAFKMGRAAFIGTLALITRGVSVLGVAATAAGVAFVASLPLIWEWRDGIKEAITDIQKWFKEYIIEPIGAWFDWWTQHKGHEAFEIVEGFKGQYPEIQKILDLEDQLMQKRFRNNREEQKDIGRRLKIQKMLLEGKRGGMNALEQVRRRMPAIEAARMLSEQRAAGLEPPGGRDINEVLKGWLTGYLDSWQQMLSEAIPAMAGILKDKLQGLLPAEEIQRILDTIFKDAKDRLFALQVQEAAESIEGQVRGGVVGSGGGGGTGEGTTLSEQAEAFFRTLGGGIADMITRAKTFGEVGKSVLQALQNDFKQKFVDQFIEKFKNGFATVYEAIDKFEQKLIDALMKALDPLMSAVIGGPGGGGILGTIFSGAASFIPGLQHGTPYVPNTGLAYLHKGERVVPAYANAGYGMGHTEINININGNADRGTIRDMKREIVETLKELDRKRYGRNRKTDYLR